MGSRLGNDTELVVAAELVVDSGLEQHSGFPADPGLHIGPGLDVAEVLAVETQAEFGIDMQGPGVDSQARVPVDAVPQVHSQAAVSPVVERVQM